MSTQDSPTTPGGGFRFPSSMGARLDRPRGWTGDLALTGFFLLTTVLPYFFMYTYGYRYDSIVEVLIGMMMVAPLALRSHYPMLMLMLTTIGGIAHMVFLAEPTPCLIVVPVEVYSVARWVDTRTSRIALVIGFAASFGGPASWVRQASGWEFNAIVLAVLVCLGMVLTPYVVGRRVRESEQAKLQRQAAERERYQRLLAEREQQARLAEVNARQQIARELHDIVAHSVSVMVVQAEGGRALAAKRPERAAEVLDTIAVTGREALTEMRRIVGVLRSGAEEGVAYAPTPGLTDIQDMVQRTGDRVRLEVSGSAPRASQATGLTAFRVVQEALTNFLKHAGVGALAVVRLRYDPDLILIEVVDDGAGANSESDGQGHGLQGMRERVAAMGGKLNAAPRPGGGFGVHVELPVIPTLGQPVSDPRLGAPTPEGNHDPRLPG